MKTRPKFLENLSESYSLRRKNAVVLTGDVHGLFWSKKTDSFVSLEQLLLHQLQESFYVVRMDMSTGVSFYDKETEVALNEKCQAMKSSIDIDRQNPLPTLVLMRGMAASCSDVKNKTKPLCVIMQYAGSLFPEGSTGSLSELDRQRLVFFLTWLSDSSFTESANILILVNPVKSEINSKITGLPNVAHIEIPLPSEEERLSFIETFEQANSGLRFETDGVRLSKDTAGLTISSIKDILEVAVATNSAVTKEQVVNEVNAILQAQLGGIIRIKYPDHSPKDIVGYRQTQEILVDVFNRCEDSETAVAAILVSGPNGGGKTFQLEAYARESGRVVIELAGLRSSLFGDTDKFTELFRWQIATLGKALILVDEAHTAFGSVHSKDTHETEKRLAGNIIKMMGDPALLGKVLWCLMTSRPDELDPDIKSRAPIQIPILDPAGDERKEFVKEMFSRKRIELSDSELASVLEKTDYYSARDYRNLVAEVLAARRKKQDALVSEVLTKWQASRSIIGQRTFQMLIAALHCSYPQLLPDNLRNLGEQEISDRVAKFKFLLNQ